jgi:Zinc finger, C2H2 type
MSNKPKIVKYPCKKCNRKFSELRYLQRHLKRKTPCTETFICAKCNKSFRNKQELTRHGNRITSCAIEEVPVVSTTNEENCCHICGKSYATPSNLRRHQKEVCNTTANPQVIQQLLSTCAKQQEFIQTLVEGGAISPVTNNVTVNNVQNNNLYVNVTICSFGSEDLSRLDTNKVMNLIKNNTGNFIPKMIEHVHANPNTPENHNVFFDPVRGKAIVFAPISASENSWQVREIREVSDLLTERFIDHIRPMNGPYFNQAAQAKDYDASNGILHIVNNTDWKTDEVLEQNKGALTTVSKNQGFLEIVDVME